MKALIIAGPILLVGGVLGAGFMGVINIPGLTPKKASAKAAAMYGEGKDLVAPIEDAVEEKPVAEAAPADKPAVKIVADQGPKTDPEKGARELAKYWGAIETKSLLGIIESFDDKELALVLSFMAKDKVAEILSKVEPLRAATLSKELRRLASVVKEETP